MSSKVVTISSVATGILLFSVGLSAHHGPGARYDFTQTVNVTGTVTDLRFINPHVLIFFDVTEEDGTVVGWSGGLTGPSRLARSDGWTKDILKPGDQISMTGAPTKNGAPSLWIEQVFLGGEPLLIQLANWRSLLAIGAP